MKLQLRKLKTKSILLLLGIAFYTSLNYAQSSREFSKVEIEKINFDFIKMSMPLFKAFEFNDKGGTYNFFLFEDSKMVSKTVSLNSKIFAVCYLEDHGGFLEKWKINDFIESPKENNIFFWEEYCQFKDIDDDGFIEPIIIYSTASKNDVYERIKIITIYKNKKYVIRAQECVFDGCRTFKKDADFNKLPKSITDHIDKLLARLRKEQGLILKNG